MIKCSELTALINSVQQTTLALYTCLVDSPLFYHLLDILTQQNLQLEQMAFKQGFYRTAWNAVAV